MAVTVMLGDVRCVGVWHCLAVKLWRGLVCWVWTGKVGQLWKGKLRQGSLGFGFVRYGSHVKERRVEASCGRLRNVWER